jgi:hypothetical protein
MDQKRIYAALIGFIPGLWQSGANAQVDLVFSDQFEDPALLYCDTATTLPCERTPEGFEELADPIVWQVDSSSGIVYRRATANELNITHWTPGTFLVDGTQLKNGTQGAQRIQTLLPLADGSVITVNLELLRDSSGLTFLQRDISGGPNDRIIDARALAPVQHEYVHQGFNPQQPGPGAGVWARMLAGDDGGVYFTGMVDGLEFIADSANPDWQIDQLPTPLGVQAPAPGNTVKIALLTLGTTGTAHFSQCAGNFAAPGCDWLCDASSSIPCDNNPHIEPAAPAHCSDNTDNDNDGKNNSADEECQSQPDWGDNNHPGTPRRNWESGKSFALLAEGRFCSRYAGNWIQRLTRMGWDSEVLANQALPFSGLTGGEMRLRYRAGGCWVFPSLAEADACADSGSGCPAGYPYNGAGNSASGYYNNVWDDVDHGTLFGFNDALHMAQAVYWGGVNAETGKPLSCQAEEGSGCCGAAFTGGSAATLGASVVQYEISTGGCNANHAPVTSAHEFGHNAGLDHDDMTGFMHSPAFPGSVLSPLNVTLLNSCFATWNCPRPSGFGPSP